MDYYSADNDGGGGVEGEEGGRVGRGEKEKGHHALCLRSRLNRER